MSRAPVFFATAAAMALLLGLLTSRFDLSAGMSLALPRAHYAIPNRMLCYGVALFFCLFAFVYSIWTVRWSAQAAMWHFSLSLLSVGGFLVALVAMDRFKLVAEPPAFSMPLLLVFIFSPVFFLLIQGFFILDGLRRCWPLLRG